MVFCISKTRQYPKYSESFAEKQPDTIRSLTLTHQRYIAPGRTRLQWGSPPEKSYLPILGTEHKNKKITMPALQYFKSINFRSLKFNSRISKPVKQISNEYAAQSQNSCNKKQCHLQRIITAG